MPSEQAVFDIADAMLAVGVKPSLRKLRDKLPTGGSPREVCKHLQAWRRKRGYDPKLEPNDMPKTMKDAAQKLGADLWKLAKREATLTFTREREAAGAVRAAETEDREHLLGMIEALQAGNAASLARAEAAEAEGRRVRERLAKVENQLERFRAEEFWDRVMREVAEILAERGPLAPADILPELRTWTVRGAALHKEPLTPGVLRKKMDMRVTHGRYFEPPRDGLYACKVA